MFFELVSFYSSLLKELDELEKDKLPTKEKLKKVNLLEKEMYVEELRLLKRIKYRRIFYLKKV